MAVRELCRLIDRGIDEAKNAEVETEALALKALQRKDAAVDMGATEGGEIGAAEAAIRAAPASIQATLKAVGQSATTEIGPQRVLLTQEEVGQTVREDPEAQKGATEAHMVETRRSPTTAPGCQTLCTNCRETQTSFQ